MKKFIDFIEDGIATTTVGTGAIAGAGVGLQGEPPGKARLTKKLLKRKLNENQVKPVHEIMNRSQLKRISRHPDFQVYIRGLHNYNDTVAARHGDHHSEAVNSFVVANASKGAPHRMHVSISPRGKYYNHDIYRRDEKDATIWLHVSSGSIDK